MVDFPKYEVHQGSEADFENSKICTCADREQRHETGQNLIKRSGTLNFYDSFKKIKKKFRLAKLSTFIGTCMGIKETCNLIELCS